MNAQDQAAARNDGQRGERASRRFRMRHVALAAFIAVMAVAATTAVMIGGSEPAHACLLPGIPC